MQASTYSQEADRDRRYALGLAALFLLCNAVVLSRHEMWLDEIQAWLIARDSASILDLLRNLKYEGHPGLWHLLLLPLTRLFASPAAMQGLHLCIGTATVYVFARHSPFSWPVKLLFAFGYFPFYEYSVMSRNYSIGVLLLFLFCALFKRRATHLPLIGLVLFLLCHTNALGLLLAMVLFGVLLAEYLLSLRHQATEAQGDPRLILAGFALMFLGIATSVLQIIPPADSGFATGATWVPQFNSLRRICTVAVAPIPSLRLNFWGTTIWGGTHASPPFTLLGLVLTTLFVLQTLRKPVALAIFVGCSAALLAFFSIKFFGAIRHHGYVYIVFIAANWLAPHCKETDMFPGLVAFNAARSGLYNALLLCLLALHVAGAAVASAIDVAAPFSCARDAADYLKSQRLDTLPMVGWPDSTSVAVLGHLGKDALYYPNRKTFGSYIIWDQARLTKLYMPQVLEQAAALGARTRQDVVLLCNAPLNAEHFRHADIRALASFTGAVVFTENYFLYVLHRPVQSGE